MMVQKGWVLSVALAAGFILPILCQATITEDCSVCHTMHNSEQGNSVAYTLDSEGQRVSSDAPFKNLLKTDCLGCHSLAGAETISSLGENLVPIVFNLSEPTYPPDGSSTSTLAGGNFHWILSDDAYGHNVNGIAGADLRFSPTQAPGGEEQTGECINCHATLATAQSGCEGCHVPHHHENNDGGMSRRAEGWYRFLGSVMQREDQAGPSPEGVVGVESPDWEQSPIPDQHNTYQGKTGPYVSYLESGAIDQKCAGCHAHFHNETIADSTWIRHPVDVAIPNSGEFIDFTSYNPLIPVARQNVSALDVNFTVINHGADLVSCISCHRAHGSPYPALMRWGYRDWPGIDSHTGQTALNGCAVCHKSKD